MIDPISNFSSTRFLAARPRHRPDEDNTQQPENGFHERIDVSWWDDEARHSLDYGVGQTPVL